MTDPLVRMAIVGTARAGGEAFHTNLPVDDLLASLQVDSRERALLLLAGAQAIYRLAGQRTPAGTTPRPAAAPLETMAEISDGASHLIASLRSEPAKRELLIEAAHRVAAVRKRLPHWMLPRILDEKEEALRTAFRPTLGERGPWLAALNEAWEWALRRALAGNELPPDAERIWEEGSFGERRAVLERLRAVLPDQAREWLAAVWSKEKAEQRVELLKTINIGLNAEDESFLEKTLDDRSAAVRVEAAAQLCRIRGSALAARMTARGDAMLSFTRASSGGLAKRFKAVIGVGTTGSIEVTLPAAVDPTWERDGIPEKPPAGAGIGQKAFWLERTLAMVPLDYWQRKFSAAPDEVVAASHANEWQESLLEGWTRSLVTLGGADWLSPLWSAWIELAAVRKSVWPGLQVALRNLLRASTQADRERRVLDLVRAQQSGTDMILNALLPELDRPWRAEFATTILNIVRTDALGSAERRNAWSSWLAMIAMAVPPELLDAALASWPEFADETADRSWRRAFAQFVETLQTRKRIHEEIVP